MKTICIDSDSIKEFLDEIKNNTKLWKEIKKKVKLKKIEILSIFGLREIFNPKETNYQKLIKIINKDYFKCNIQSIDSTDVQVKKNIKEIKKIKGIKQFDDEWFLYKCLYEENMKDGSWILITNEKRLPGTFKNFKNEYKIKIGNYLRINQKKSHLCL